MRLARYRRLVGTIVYIKNDNRLGKRMHELGMLAGVITDVLRTPEGIVYEINCRCGEERKTFRADRRVFTLRSPNGRERLEQLIGLTAHFSNEDKSGREMIGGGIKDGIIRNVTKSQDGALLYEICFGPGGERRFTLFYRSAFTFKPTEPAQN